MSKSQTLCVDANLVIRLVAFPQDEMILSLWEQWEGHRLAAPALLFYEITNALHQYQKARWLTLDEIETALQAAARLPIKIVEDPALHLEAVRIAARLELLAAYGAHYLALAERLDAELWTADKRLANVARQHGLDWVRSYQGWVDHLGEAE